MEQVINGYTAGVSPKCPKVVDDLIDFRDFTCDDYTSSMFASDNSIATVLDKSGIDNCNLTDESSSERLYEGVANGSTNGCNNLLDSPLSAFTKKPSSANSSLSKKTRSVSSNAFASQLYYGRPGGSSTRSMNLDGSSFLSNDDDLGSSVSDTEVLHRHTPVGAIEIHDICDQVQRLEQHLSAMQEHRQSVDEKHIRLKQENAVLQERLHNLDEQMQASEERWKQRLVDEQRKAREAQQRLERERALELDALTLKLQLVERERDASAADARKARRDADAANDEREQLRAELRTSRDELRAVSARRNGNAVTADVGDKMLRLANEDAERRLHAAMDEIDRLRSDNEILRNAAASFAASPTAALEPGSSSSDYEQELRPLREELRALRDRNAELHAELLQASVEQGRRLLNDNVQPSLAQELDSMSNDEILNALKDQEIVNQKLRTYVDGILLKIMETYPALLEIKPGEDKFPGPF